jgi:hypothetical protein
MWNFCGVSKVKSLIFDARYLLCTLYPLLQEEGGAAALQGVPPVSGGTEAGLPPPQGEAGGSGSWRPGNGSLPVNPKPGGANAANTRKLSYEIFSFRMAIMAAPNFCYHYYYFILLQVADTGTSL